MNRLMYTDPTEFVQQVSESHIAGVIPILFPKLYQIAVDEVCCFTIFFDDFYMAVNLIVMFGRLAICEHAHAPSTSFAFLQRRLQRLLCMIV